MEPPVEPEPLKLLLDYFKSQGVITGVIATEISEEYAAAHCGSVVRQRYIEVLIDLMKWVESA